MDLRLLSGTETSHAGADSELAEIKVEGTNPDHGGSLMSWRKQWTLWYMEVEALRKFTDKGHTKTFRHNIQSSHKNGEGDLGERREAKGQTKAVIPVQTLLLELFI